MPSARTPSTSTVEPVSAALAGREEAGDPGAVGVAVALRHQLGQRAADHLGGAVAEDRLGAGVPEDDPPVAVGGDDPVAGRAGDGAEPLLGGAQLLLALLARGDVLAAEEDELVGGGVAGAEHQPAVAAVAGAQAQLGRRPLARAAREQVALEAWRRSRGRRGGRAGGTSSARELLGGPAEQRLPRGVRPRQPAVGAGDRQQVVRHRRTCRSASASPAASVMPGRRVRGGGSGRRHRRWRPVEDGARPPHRGSAADRPVLTAGRPLI